MALIELNDVTKLFGKLAAVEDFDLQVNKGEILGIVGPNGSGKTTLINVISGYYKPTRGTVYFDGRKISGLRPDQIARLGIVRTFQSNVLYEGASVIESMMIGSKLQYKTSDWQAFFETRAFKAEQEKVVGNILDTLRLLDIFNETFRPAAALSHGYQRMLGISLALAANPSVLLLDEPTTGMNHEEAMFVVENIKKINQQGITVLEMMSKPEVIEAYLGTEKI
ncbi:MAG: ATP-binding cassette domain-containing protein [Dehalococcoidia bacterium]